MKNKVIILMMLSLASISHIHAMEKEKCNKPLSFYPTIVDAYQSFQDIYNKPDEREELEDMASFAQWWFIRPLLEISKSSFLETNAINALSILDDTINKLNNYLTQKQQKTGLPAGGITGYKQPSFYHISNLLYQLQQLYNEIHSVCSKK